MKERSTNQPIHAIRLVLIFILLAIAVTAAILCAKLYSFYRVEHDKLDLTWTNKKDVSIFKASYTDGDGIVTVRGENEDNVIAPGTSNSYQFRLQNSFEVGMDYTLTLKVSGANDNFELPVYVRLYTVNGEYVVGSEEQGVKISELQDVSHSKTLDVNGYTDYIFYWEWPYEQGLDAYDTILAITDTAEVPVFSVSLGTTSIPNYSRSGGLSNYNIYRTTMYIPVLVLIVLIVLGLLILLLSFLARRNKQMSLAALPTDETASGTGASVQIGETASGTGASAQIGEIGGNGTPSAGDGNRSVQKPAAPSPSHNRKPVKKTQKAKSSDWRENIWALGTAVALGVLSVWISKNEKENGLTKKKKNKEKRR